MKMSHKVILLAGMTGLVIAAKAMLTPAYAATVDPMAQSKKPHHFAPVSIAQASDMSKPKKCPVIDPVMIDVASKKKVVVSVRPKIRQAMILPTFGVK